MPDSMGTSRHDDLALRYVMSVPGGAPAGAEMPLVVVMHGRGADANDLADIAPALDHGYRFVFPNAQKAFEAYPGMTLGYTWFDGWPPAGSAIVESRELLLRFIDEVVERYPTPAGKLIISGFSQGALMSLDVGFRTAKKVAGIAVMSGALYEPDLPDLRKAKDIPVLIVHGTDDDMIPVIAAWRTRRVLEDHGIEPEYHEFPMGHWVTPESLAVVGEFMRRCLGSSE
jgi:phospholipase/carboxylesterase